MSSKNRINERLSSKIEMNYPDFTKVPGVVFKHTLVHFSVEELADAMIVLGYYRMLSGFIQTFNISIDPQENGNWVKG